MGAAIIVVGGFNSIWPVYLRLARHLEDLTGNPCVAVPLMPHQWQQAARQQDATTILERLERTVAWAGRRLGTERIVLVGHSAGGVICRLYVCDLPVWGQQYAGRCQVNWLITLGSPHCSERGTETGWFLTDEANRLAPGAPREVRIRCRAIAGKSVASRQEGNWGERRAYHSYRFFGAQPQDWGDGVVPLQCAALAGTELVVLPGVTHSRKYGPNWYGGSANIVRSWWPKDAASPR